MAFNIQGFGRSSSNYNNRTGGGIHTYITDDTLATVEASGYFDDAVGIANIDNFILAKASDGEKLLRITSSTIPITVIESGVGGGFNFTSGVETIAGVDSINGDVYEILNLDGGLLPNNTSSTVALLPGSTGIDWTKPVKFVAWAKSESSPIYYPMPLELGVSGAALCQISVEENPANGLEVGLESNFNASTFRLFIDVRYYKV